MRISKITRFLPFETALLQVLCSESLQFHDFQTMALLKKVRFFLNPHEKLSGAGCSAMKSKTKLSVATSRGWENGDDTVVSAICWQHQGFCAGKTPVLLTSLRPWCKLKALFDAPSTNYSHHCVLEIGICCQMLASFGFFCQQCCAVLLPIFNTGHMMFKICIWKLIPHVNSYACFKFASEKQMWLATQHAIWVHYQNLHLKTNLESVSDAILRDGVCASRAASWQQSSVLKKSHHPLQELRSKQVRRTSSGRSSPLMHNASVFQQGSHTAHSPFWTWKIRSHSGLKFRIEFQLWVWWAMLATKPPWLEIRHSSMTGDVTGVKQVQGQVHCHFHFFVTAHQIFLLCVWASVLFGVLLLVLQPFSWVFANNSFPVACWCRQTASWHVRSDLSTIQKPNQIHECRSCFSQLHALPFSMKWSCQKLSTLSCVLWFVMLLPSSNAKTMWCALFGAMFWIISKLCLMINHTLLTLQSCLFPSLVSIQWCFLLHKQPCWKRSTDEQLCSVFQSRLPSSWGCLPPSKKDKMKCVDWTMV